MKPFAFTNLISSQKSIIQCVNVSSHEFDQILVVVWKPFYEPFYFWALYYAERGGKFCTTLQFCACEMAPSLNNVHELTGERHDPDWTKDLFAPCKGTRADALWTKPRMRTLGFFSSEYCRGKWKVHIWIETIFEPNCATCTVGSYAPLSVCLCK